MAESGGTPGMIDPTFRDFDIKEADDGAWHAVRADLKVTVLPDGDARLFHRREGKPFAKPPVYRSALVAELDGVRVWIRDGHIVVTRRNLKLTGEGDGDA